MQDETRHPIVKICGLSTTGHVLAAAAHGADLLGFVFAPSRRQVEAASVRRIRDAFGGTAQRPPPFVGVFVDASASEIAATAESAGLDLVQFSGDEEPSLAASLAMPYIRAIRVGAHAHLDDALREADGWMSLPRPPRWLLVDAAVPGSYGGSGQRANWEIAKQLAYRYPTLLAGGLDQSNVAEGLAATGAAGVDVSSGVEIDGVKDTDLITRFILAANGIQ